MSTDQIATQFVDTLAEIRRIDPGTEHPMRHQVRHLKRQAMEILEEAIRRAHELAAMAEDIVSDYDKAAADGQVGASHG